MKLALNTVTIQPAPLFDKIVATSKAGFEGIEFHVHEIYDYLVDGGSRVVQGGASVRRRFVGTERG